MKYLQRSLSLLLLTLVFSFANSQNLRAQLVTLEVSNPSSNIYDFGVSMNEILANGVIKVSYQNKNALGYWKNFCKVTPSVNNPNFGCSHTFSQSVETRALVQTFFGYFSSNVVEIGSVQPCSVNLISPSHGDLFLPAPATVGFSASFSNCNIVIPTVKYFSTIDGEVAQSTNIFNGFSANGQLSATNGPQNHQIFARVYEGADLRGESSKVTVYMDGQLAEQDENSAVNFSIATLNGNYPEPFNPTTNITFTVENDADIKVSVFDMTGKLVQELASGFHTAGNYEVSFDASTHPSGIYLYTLEAAGIRTSKKMTLMK